MALNINQSLLDKTRGRWQEILPHFGFEINPKKHTICPKCGKKNFRCTNRYGNGDFICNCGFHGTGITLLLETTGFPYRELAEKIENLLGLEKNNHYIPSKPKNDEAKIKWMKKWENGVKLQNTLGEEYLKGRNIKTLPTGGVKFLAREAYYKDDDDITYHNALLAIASSVVTGEAVIAHVTYLNGSDKLKGVGYPTSRKTHIISRTEQEKNQPIAVKLFKLDSDKLIVAEGIETALSGHDFFGKKIPAWACLNSNYLAKFEPPKNVKHLIILADNDLNSATGHVASYTCAKKALLDAKNNIQTVSVLVPVTPYNDFNDLLSTGIERKDCFTIQSFHKK